MAGALVSAALSPDLYSGSAGIALLLAELYGQTGDDVFLRTAQGSLRRSIEQIERVTNRPQSSSPLSFFGGHLGVAYAANRLMLYSDSIDFYPDIARLLVTVEASLDTQHPLDVTGGNAGAIPVLLSLSQHLRKPPLRDLAIRCADELCERAQWNGDHCVWDAKVATGLDFSSPLAGYAHGASGIARALLEIYGATSEPRFRRTARGAFAYEKLLFSERHGNWKDARFSQPPSPSPDEGPFPVAWCHGAPGICLACARAKDLDPELAEEYETIVSVALGTVKTTIDQLVLTPTSDVSLCHGASGLSEIALIVSKLSAKPDLARLSVELARALFARFGETGEWPSGLPDAGPHPSLMLGSAGVAHHFLRIYKTHTVAPVLLIQSV
jgi:lantibiotic modifying enzyme